MTVTAPPPSPSAVTDEATFVAGLRALKSWSGFSFRQLERRAAAAGDTLPSSTAAGMLGRNRLPRAEILVAFVRACGLGQEDARAWAGVRARIAAGGEAVTAPRTDAVERGAAEEAVGGETVVSEVATRRRARRVRWWRPAVVVAALAMAFAGGAALMGDASVDVQETTAAVTR